MAQTYTTGQIIDILKPGQKAKNQNGHYVECDPSGAIYFSDGSALYANATCRAMKWTLLPQYVTFEEAIAAYMDYGKTVVYHHAEDLEYKFGESFNDFKQLGLDSIELYEMIKGKWSIVETEEVD